MNMSKIYAFSTVDDNITNRLLNNVAVSDSSKASHSVSIKAKNIFKMDCIALWDTGATNTVISPKIVTALRLPTFGEIEVWGVSGPSQTTVHVIDLWLPNFVAIPKLMVTMGIIRNIDVLIGMDVINKGDFAISNFEGRTSFTFRIPSMKFTDYCKELI